MAENFPFFMTATISLIVYRTYVDRTRVSRPGLVPRPHFGPVFLSHVSRRKEARLDACKIKIETAPVGWYKNTLKYKSAYFEWPRGALANP